MSFRRPRRSCRRGRYAHYIRTARALSPFRLSEPEEIILEETANTGSRAWDRLFEELTSNQVFKLDGEDKTQQEVLTLLRDPDRAVRQKASDALTAGLKEIERTLVYLYNTLLLDKSVGRPPAGDDVSRAEPAPRERVGEVDGRSGDRTLRGRTILLSRATTG